MGAVPAVKEEAEEAEETEEEVIPSPPPQPLKLKRTASVVPAEKKTVKKTINKVRRDIATSQPPSGEQGQGQVEQPERVSIPASIYGREIRNERVKQKTEKI